MLESKIKYFKIVIIIFNLVTVNLIVAQKYCDVIGGNAVNCIDTPDFDLKSELQLILQKDPDNKKDYASLSLANTELTIIPANAFSDLTFKYIFISNAHDLRKLSTHAFNGRIKDVVIDLIFFNTSSLVSDSKDYNIYKAFNSLTKLNRLEISLDTSIEHNIPEFAFGSAQYSLKVLHFDGKYNITNIGDYAFKGLANLTELAVSYIRFLKHISSKAFSIDSINNETIDVKLNQLGLNELSFDFGVFSGSKRKLSINLSKNQINYINESIFGEFFDSSNHPGGTIDFNDNPLDCDHLEHLMWILEQKLYLQTKLLNLICHNGTEIWDLNYETINTSTPTTVTTSIPSNSTSTRAGVIVGIIAVIIFVNLNKKKKSKKQKMIDVLMAMNQFIPNQCLSLEGIIGSGYYGVVYSAQYMRFNEDPIKVAVKTVKIGSTRSEMSLCLKEGMLLLGFSHIRVLTPLGISINSNGVPLIIYPYMKNGDLLTYLREKKKILTIKDLLEFGHQISEGMEYLSGQNFVHRDLAARNCLLDDNGVKIGDFGLSRDMYAKQYYRCENQIPLPFKWMAPEAIQEGFYSQMSDVWSFGVLFWEILTHGSDPYSHVKQEEIIHYIKSNQRLPKPPLCSDKLFNLLLMCWEMDKELRPKFCFITQSIQSVIDDITKGVYAVESNGSDFYTFHPLF